jgi:hypothetical protein
MLDQVLKLCRGWRGGEGKGREREGAGADMGVAPAHMCLASRQPLPKREISGTSKIWVMNIDVVACGSFAKEVDERLLEVRCPKCKRYMSVTFNEVRCGMVVPCPNCEAWIPLMDAEGIFQDLYEVARSFDRKVEISCAH